MKTPDLETLADLNARLSALTLEMAAVKSALAIQFTRTAELQAALDLLPSARRRRRVMRTSLLLAAHTGNGNGNGHGRSRG